MTCSLVSLTSGGATVQQPLVSTAPAQFLCNYTAHCFPLCLCCDFYACDCRMQCPANCTCYHDSTWQHNVIECSHR
jgi:hypothetical protein